MQYSIRGKRIRKLLLPKEFDKDIIQIGVPVKGDEAQRVGLEREGDIVLPSERFGSQSKKNAYGYSYADKMKPKERRYVSTNWIQPFGNDNASSIPVDIYRECYPKTYVPAYEIELQLYKSKSGNSYVIVNLTKEIRERFLKEAINLLLEIYGVCYIFDKDIQIDDSIKRQRCNWEILPAGEMPSKHIEKQLREHGEKADTYDKHRLEYIEKYHFEKAVEGVKGFKGYYAYVSKKYCVLESAVYGKATYIIPEENWEILSQKTKKELFDEGYVIKKIDHTKSWEDIIRTIFASLNIGE